MSDRSWMYRRKDHRGNLRREYMQGVDEFFQFAYSYGFVDVDRILCPCSRCRNRFYKNLDDAKYHLYKYGFVKDYLIWVNHGEVQDFTCNMFVGESSRYEPSNLSERDNMTRMRDMVSDAMHGNVESNDEPGHMHDDDEEPPNRDASVFYSLIEAGNEPLYEGCTSHTRLSAVAQLLSCKSDMNLSNSQYDKMMSIFMSMLPPNKLPKDFRSAKHMMKQFGLRYKKIHVCKNFCTLFYGENEGLLNCNVCGHLRYREKNTSVRNGRPKPYKVMWYLPIIPRLQRLFMIAGMSEAMVWHASFKPEEGTMSHPSHGEAWRHFDHTHPDFAFDPRNVRLSLCTDGFSPFTHSAKPYSCWPILLTVLNLPPWMAMKQEYTILSAVIPGPKSPGKDLDLFLRPLIDDLKLLWNVGVNTYDAARKQNFMLRAALMWTVSDFPAYAMLSGWSTKGNLACPCCMGDTDAFRLDKGRKSCWFDCHRRFLPESHPFRRKKNSFLSGEVVRKPPPLHLTGEQIWQDYVADLPEYEHGLFALNNIDNYGTTHHFFKRSIFWELPYWKTNLIRHTLDVMHIEKNVFDNIFYTLMDVKGKTKDNAQAREDMKRLCKRPELNLVQGPTGRIFKPKAVYTLTKEQRQLILDWLVELKFPDGYASNLGNCFDRNSGHIYGMKSHDCHVFMQRLLPIALRDIVPIHVWDAITELSTFFKDLCSPTLRTSHLEVLQHNIVVTLCKLEQIFPPSFFDSMEHLPIHLPYEATVCGPVQYHWMYPYERQIGNLKKKVTNKAAVEGSICEAYIVQEMATFCSLYFNSDVATRLNRVPRNDRVDNDEYDGPAIFRRVGEPLRLAKYSRELTPDEFNEISLYVIINCDIMVPVIEDFYDFVRMQNPAITDTDVELERDRSFLPWLTNFVSRGGVDCRYIKSLSYGPASTVRYHNGYFINGFKFYAQQYEGQRKTTNSGVCVLGSSSNGYEQDYYGTIKEIVEIYYIGIERSIVLFKCEWYNLVTGVRTHAVHRLVEIRKSSILKTNPFVLAEQCQQVCYIKYPAKARQRQGWFAVCNISARNKIQLPTAIEDGDGTDNLMESIFQETPCVPPVYVHLPEPSSANALVDADIFDDVEDDMHNEDVDIAAEGFDGTDVVPVEYDDDDEYDDEEIEDGEDDDSE